MVQRTDAISSGLWQQIFAIEWYLPGRMLGGPGVWAAEFEILYLQPELGYFLSSHEPRQLESRNAHTVQDACTRVMRLFS